MNPDQARSNMIEQQIRPWNVVDDDVLNVMQQVPREFFVPDAYKQLAFSDTEIPLGEGQSMMAPKIEAHMMQALSIKPGDKVLEIGTGSGYVATCLSWLSGDVTSIEISESLSALAAEHINALGDSDVYLMVGDIFDTPFSSRFDVIAVTGGLPAATDRFEKMLNIGGRLFQVVGSNPGSAQLIVRTGEESWIREELFETELTALTNAPEPDAFVF